MASCRSSVDTKSSTTTHYSNSSSDTRQPMGRVEVSDWVDGCVIVGRAVQCSAACCVAYNDAQLLDAERDGDELIQQ